MRNPVQWSDGPSKNGKIYKYPIRDTAVTLEIPELARILSVREQRGQIMLWALVEPDAPLRERRIVIIGTGHDMPNGRLDFIETFFMANGDLVFHAFEVLT